MGLKKQSLDNDNRPIDVEQRVHCRSYEGLLNTLDSDDPSQRRWAARDLRNHMEAVEEIFKALLKEKDYSVRDALFDSLQQIGGDKVVSGLIDLLRVEDAVVRNTAIEILQTMPQGVADHIIELLNDQSSDVRIFAVDILQVLAHPKTPEWLLSVLKEESHINVIANVVDRLAEVGTVDMIPCLLSVKDRFPNEDYLSFAVDTAVARIQGE